MYINIFPYFPLSGSDATETEVTLSPYMTHYGILSSSINCPSVLTLDFFASVEKFRDPARTQTREICDGKE